MSIVLQISDPHFGTEQPPVVEALVELSAQHRPDVVVLSGDVTQRARPEQFRAAKAFVDRLNVKTLTIPGNHDIPLLDLGARFLRPYGHFSAEFGIELEPVFSSRDLLLQCLNTTRRYRHTNGEVSAEQIARVSSRLLSAQPEQLRIVVVHQPVAVLHVEDQHDRLRGFAAAVHAWADAGCDLVMGGHIHLPYVTELPGLRRRMWAVQAGTAVSSRVRDGAPNSVNLLRWGDGDSWKRRCLIEQWDYDGARQVFLLKKVTQVRPARA